MGGVSFGRCPWHEFVDARCGPEIDELVEDVGDVGLRLDVVELARLDQRGDAGPVFGPLVMTSEERVLAIENDRADAALDNVGVEFDASVVEEADEPFPMVQTITKFVGDPGLARDARQLMLEPGPERHDERFAVLLAHAATLVGACAPDRLLDRVERGDSLKRLTGDWRFTLGVVEEPAPQVRPAEGERDPAIGRLGGDRLVGGVTVALNNARIIVEQLQAVDRPAAGCVGEGDGRRVRAAPWSIVAGDRPEVA